MKPLLEQIDHKRLPRHIAVIMDGNGRWAKLHGDERSSGHIAGVRSVREIIETASKLGIEYLTLYAFSTENWKRPKAEVDMLLSLIVKTLTDETENLKRNNVSLSMIGDMSRLPEDARRKLIQSIDYTASSTGLKVNLALSYSSRWEITEAVRQIAEEAATGKIEPSAIDESTVQSHLSTALLPDPDIMIRTGGDKRISNFLLWQLSYSELYFTEVFWPEFTADDLYKAIIEYQSRERRYGMTSEQITNHQS